MNATMEGIAWRPDLETAQDDAERHDQLVLIELFSPQCFGCQNLERRTFSDRHVQDVVAEQFAAVHYDVLNHPAYLQRYAAVWTPTLIVQDVSGREHRRFTGFLPPVKFLGELALARIADAMYREDYNRAHVLAQDAVEATQGDELRHSEALYWQAVTAYKASGNADRLGGTKAPLATPSDL